MVKTLHLRIPFRNGEGSLTLRAGEVFANRFEIECVAACGGMGTVYRAKDLYSGNLIALKLLQGSATGFIGGDAERFAREAQLLSELRHENIVAYIAHGQTLQGQRFLAMEWLHGETLAQRLSRQPLTLSESLLMISRVAEALAFAHRRGIIHREV